MSKHIFLVFSILLFYISTSAQVLVHQFFPMMINVDMFGDTLINKKEILAKAGIRKITIRQIPPIVSSSFASKTYSLDQNGNIESLQFCLYNPESFSVFCMNNIFWYASTGQKSEIKMYDAKETLYCKFTTEWLDKNSAKYTSTTIFNGVVSGDTLTDYKYYNEKGQPIKLTKLLRAAEPFHILYYYNNDGLLDSASYSDPSLQTTKFSRKHRRKNTLIEMEHPRGRYTWTYNSSGQCTRILFEIITQVPIPNQQPYLFGKPKPVYKKSMEMFYYYNSNGTLSKITERQNNGKELSVIYSYE